MAWTLVGALAAALLAVAWRGRRSAAQLEQRLRVASQELEALQQAFSRFAPAQVVEHIIAEGVSAHPEKKDVTVLFADLKGFTALGERLDPAVLVGMLNDYFERMSHVIAAHGGHVSKFIGDGILALFGALDSNPWQTSDAVRAAFAMQAALGELNAQRPPERPQLAMGIGVHHGPVVAGVMGSTELVEYGVIGSTVNVASRVQGLTRVHDVDILVTAAVRAHLDPRVVTRAMPAVAVKGLPEPLVTFAVEAPGSPPADAPR
jgi:adenylate cyclase